MTSKQNKKETGLRAVPDRGKKRRKHELEDVIREREGKEENETAVRASVIFVSGSGAFLSGLEFQARLHPGLRCLPLWAWPMCNAQASLADWPQRASSWPGLGSRRLFYPVSKRNQSFTSVWPSSKEMGCRATSVVRMIRSPADTAKKGGRVGSGHCSGARDL